MATKATLSAARVGQPLYDQWAYDRLGHIEVVAHDYVVLRRTDGRPDFLNERELGDFQLEPREDAE